MRVLPSSFLFISGLALLQGCSSGSSSSSTSNIEGWVGAQGFNNAQVVVSQIAEAGQINEDSNGTYIGLRESTDTQSRYTATVNNDEAILLVARGQIADVDKDKNNLATLRQCQVVTGCTVGSGSYGFSQFYPATTGYEWRTVIYSANNDGGRNNINPLTTLASAYAYQYDVRYGYDAPTTAPESGVVAETFENEIFTPYDIVLANSQITALFGLNDVIGDIPAKLTQLDVLGGNTITSRNQIRYAAFIAAIQKLSLEHAVNSSDDFLTAVTEQFVADNGQLYLHTPASPRLLTQQSLWQAAHDNLQGTVASIKNAQVIAAANAVISTLSTELASISNEANANTTTTAKADELALLLTADEIVNFNLGLEKTKLFVKSILELEENYWQAGYKTELQTYLNMLTAVGEAQKDNLKALTQQFADIQAYYVTCSIGNVCDSFAAFAALHNPSYDAVSKILTLDNGKVTVSQELADIDLDPNNNDDVVTQSQAVDIFITGELQVGNLVLTLAHDLNADEIRIDVPSAMRIYYTEVVTEARADLDIYGYEMIWGEFQFYDKTTLSTTNELELSGAFRIFYRGVKNPQDSTSELRFNIDEWVLTTSISDKVDDDTYTDRESTSIVMTASTSNALTFYPETKLTQFDGFFTANANASSLGDVEADLLTYKVGTETVLFAGSQLVAETIDFINKYDDDIRYRFYPDERVEDEFDSDGDGDIAEIVDMHRIEECVLSEDDSSVVTCGPKAKVYEKRNLQNTINDLWELGAFRNVVVDAQGTYFVDLPTKAEGECIVLDDLAGERSFSGELIEQQVLGLDTVRLYTEVLLEDANLVDLPRTLVDISVVAPTVEKYRVDAALSHNYSGSTVDSSGIVLGTGGDSSVVRIGYDTSADFENTGNISIFKGGVSLTLADGSTVVENQDITAFLAQTYSADNINYIIKEDENGLPDRCILPGTDPSYDKNTADLEQVFYLNYRGVVYGTIRPEGNDGIWVIRYIDGAWLVPATAESSGS